MLINKWSYQTCIVSKSGQLWAKRVFNFGQTVDQLMNLPYLHRDQKWLNVVKSRSTKWTYHTCMVISNGQIWSTSWSTKWNYNTCIMLFYQICSESSSHNEIIIRAWWSKVIKFGQHLDQENGLTITGRWSKMVKFGQKVVQKMNLPCLRNAFW